MTKKEIFGVIHRTIYQFFDICGDNEEAPLSDKDKLLLEVNKAICNNIRALEQKSCEDAVSKQQVIKAVDSHTFDTDKGLCLDNDISCILEDLLPLSNQEWIPCSERLPEKNMACLVSVGKLNFRQIAMYSDLMGIKDHKIFYQGTVGYADFEDITEKVNAWMPLPKPYKTETESNDGN